MVAALSWFEIGLAAVVAVALTRIVAPYGRHARPGWGPTLPARVAWVAMEAPSALVYAAVALATHGSPVYAAFWLAHYGYRGFVYPLRQPGGRPMPASVAAMGASFNLLNASINASIPAPDPSRYASAPFWLGAALFVAGLALNHDADARLRAVRARVGGYGIPTGGAYRWVSCPNYLGEIVQWWGWAALTGSLPGLAFAVFTTANLAPRAVAHHAWYRRTFPDYPPERTALVPWPRLTRAPAAPPPTPGP